MENALTDPFDVLDMAGVRSRRSVNILSELLGEVPRPLRATPAMRPANPPATRGRGTAWLDELHDEFMRVVRDPTQLAGRADWEDFPAADGESAPTLEALSKQAEPYPLLRDILLPREGIDLIIEGFEPLGRPGLLEAEPPEEILRLFAPEPARDARASLPILTRREHHDLSPDSHVRIGSARVGDDEDAAR